MVSSEEQLNQLQTQLNQVLEQTGRVFAAINANPKEKPVAQAAKLKKMLPGATNAFHEALDQMENEIQIAMVAMRRDFALCRERSGKPAPAAVEPVSHQAPPKPDEDVDMDTLSKDDTSAGQDANTSQQAIHDSEPPAADEDIVMEDSNQEPDAKPAAPDEQLKEDLTSTVPDVKRQHDESDAKLAEAQKSESNDANPTNGLQVDTQPPAEDNKLDEKPAEDEKAPDTANDLDSLFGGPMSAGGGVGDSNDFTFDQNDTGDIDFGTFGEGFDANNADNDNISSLLPGLEDYANTQPNATEEVDLDKLFNLNNDDQNNGNDQQKPGEQHDTTFDDLMDLADFQGGVEGDGNENAADFDFDSLFN